MRCIVGEGVRNEISTFLTNHFPDLTRILIITDETVGKIHLDKLVPLVSKWDPVIFTAPSGEKAKTFEVFYDALSMALENRSRSKIRYSCIWRRCDRRLIWFCCCFVYEGNTVYSSTDHHPGS